MNAETQERNPLPGSRLLDKVTGPGALLPLQKETRLLNGGCYLVPPLDGKDFHNAAFSRAAVIQNDTYQQ